MRMRKRYQLPAALFLLSVTVVLFGLLTGGCSNLPVPPADVQTAITSPVVPAPVELLGERRAVIVGLTGVNPAAYGGWAGACPGCDLDAQRMRVALTGVPTVYLTNNTATAYRFVAACSAQALTLKPGGLLVVYISGHGGQVADPGDTSETDGKSETLCLWDGQLTDNLMWMALCKMPAGVRVAFISDTCNSGTNYRAPRDYTRVMTARASRAPGELKCDFLHIGGCADGLSSYGGDDGGELTNALLYALKKSGPTPLTWEQWFLAAAARMPRNQRPVFAEMGKSFKDKEVLK